MYNENLYAKEYELVKLLRLPLDIEKEVEKYFFRKYEYEQISNDDAYEIKHLVDKYECKIEVEGYGRISSLVSKNEKNYTFDVRICKLHSYSSIHIWSYSKMDIDFIYSSENGENRNFRKIKFLFNGNKRNCIKEYFWELLGLYQEYYYSMFRGK